MAKTNFVKPNQDYMPEGDTSLLQKNIEELGLSEYTLTKLKGVEIDKIIDLCRCQMKHLYKIPGINKKNVFEVLKKLQNVGLDFKRSPIAATTAEDGKQEVAKNNGNVQTEKKEKNNFNDKQNKNNKGAVNKAQDNNKNTNNNPKFEKGKKEDKKPNFETKATANNKHNSDNKNNNNKQNFDNKKQNQPQKAAKPEPVKQAQEMQKSQPEPKRMKVNSYDIDSFINDSIPAKKTLKQEREEKIAKAIKDLPPIKNPDGLYKFYRHGKWGYKTESGKVVIEPTYTEAFNFREGLACVELNERCGYINKQGEIVIPIQYDTACSFSEGLASVTKDDKCGYIDKEGNVVFDFIYEAATSFENDIAIVKKDGKWGYMDRKTGEIRLR